MKVISFSFIPVFLLAVFCFNGCDKEDNGDGFYEITISEELPDNLSCPPDVIYGEKADIIGRWQLLTAETWSDSLPNKKTDLSCESVIYIFFKDGTLMRSGAVEQFPSGIYTYVFSGNMKGCEECYPGPNLHFNHSRETWAWENYCIVMKSVMQINTPTSSLFFARIKDSPFYPTHILGRSERCARNSKNLSL